MGSDLFLANQGVINFNDEITIQQDANNLKIKGNGTSDDNPIILTLQTGELDIHADDVKGTINFGGSR